jgi:hypothetical protein
VSPELEDKLVSKYPQLFAGVTKAPEESLMRFGCECGDGWYEILSAMCFLIQQHIDNNKIDGQPMPFEFTQIKEKFAGLRVYFQGGDNYIQGAVDMAESLSYKTCEETGDRGTVHVSSGGYWLRTLSPKAAKLLEYRPQPQNDEEP